MTVIDVQSDVQSGESYQMLLTSYQMLKDS